MYVWNDVKGVEKNLNSFNCYSCYSCWKGQKWCLQLLHNTVNESAWRMWACRVPLEVTGSVSGKVGSNKQVKLPIHKLQHWMLGCQLPQTCLSLIAYTWPIFDLSRSCTPYEPPAQLTKELVWAWQMIECTVICQKGSKEVKTRLYSMKFNFVCGR